MANLKYIFVVCKSALCSSIHAGSVLEQQDESICKDPCLASLHYFVVYCLLGRRVGLKRNLDQQDNYSL